MRKVVVNTEGKKWQAAVVGGSASYVVLQDADEYELAQLLIVTESNPIVGVTDTQWRHLKHLYTGSY